MNNNNQQVTKHIAGISQKITSLIPRPSAIKSDLELPDKKWQPFFLKVMDDFIKHHNLPATLLRPQGNVPMHVAMARILDAMAYSMGQEKRDQIMKDLNEYIRSLGNVISEE